MNVSRRDFLKAVILGMGITFLSPSLLAKTVIKNSDNNKNLESLIRNFKEKYKDADFENEISLGYNLSLGKIDLDLPGLLSPFEKLTEKLTENYLRSNIEVSVFLRSDKLKGLLDIEADILSNYDRYRIETYYYSNEIGHLQIIGEVPYKFVKKGNEFHLIDNMEGYSKNYYNKKNNFKTAAIDGVTAAKQILINPIDKRFFYKTSEIDIKINKEQGNNGELEKIVIDLTSLNEPAKKAEYYALKFKGKLIPIYGTVYAENTWIGIPYELELYGQINLDKEQAGF